MKSRILILLACLAFAPVTFTGCKNVDPSGVYAGDKTLYAADTAIADAYGVLHTFVTFEYQNRAMLASKPEIKVAADNVRRNAQKWITTAIAARDAYESSPNTANKSVLQSALSVLQAAISQASQYLKSNQ